jgi:hypothetical protein
LAGFVVSPSVLGVPLISAVEAEGAAVCAPASVDVARIVARLRGMPVTAFGHSVAFLPRLRPA